MSYVEARSLTRSLGVTQVLNDCSFTLERGTITGVIGPNGSGKTTLFNVLTGYDQVDGGQIVFDGKDVTHLSCDRIARLGMVRTFQHPRIFPRLTVMQHMQVVEPVSHGLQRFLPGTHASSRAQHLLEFLGLLDKEGTAADSLSYGQKKLLEIGCVLMTRPRVLLLDEPMAGLHPTTRSFLHARLRSLRVQTGMTIMIIEHRSDIITTLCDSVIVLHHGTILARGPAREIYHHPRVREAYVGEN